MKGVTRAWIFVALAVAGAGACLLFQAFSVRPFLPPAGHGAAIDAETPLLEGVAPRLPLARPPAPEAFARGIIVVDVPERTAAAAAGVRPGDRVLRIRNLSTGRTVDRSTPPRDGLEAVRAWRDAYRLGPRGAIEVTLARADGTVTTTRVERPPSWSLPWDLRMKAVAVHVGPMIESMAIVGAAVVLLLLRPRSLSALLIVGTLAMTGTSTSGALLGSENVLPPQMAAPLTVFQWMAMPLAFPLIALAVLYFPSKSRVLVKYPWLHAVPLVVALPMIVPAAGTALYLAGMEGAAGMAAWDATHGNVFAACFVAGLVLNISAMVEGVWRYKHNPDPLERRRVAVATFTLVLATIAFTIKDGVPALASMAGGVITYPRWFTLFLHLVTALAGVGITYAVAVHRVLAPRVAVRASLQYALARKTLGIAGALPATLLVVTLFEQRERSLSAIVSGQPLFYAALLAAVIAAFKYRDRARAWVDQRFFRQEYDARAVLLSLSGRIPYETDPNELTALVVNQIDAALHPTMVAVLVGGVEPDTLVPVSVLHGTADTLAERGGIGTMLGWSDTPLDLDLGDERSAAARLPPDEIEWLRCTGATLFVPLTSGTGTTKQLLGALVLGAKRSEEPYTADDRSLLSSIAAQVSLGLDVARLRRRQSLAASDSMATALPADAMTMAADAMPWLAGECPHCGKCYEPDVTTCPDDGLTLRRGRLPRVVDGKYRVDQVLGRGGMGAVYRAHDMRLERDVAIKVVRPELLGDPDARARFRREAQVVARLQHPGIVSVFDYGTLPDGAAYLVMEFVRGRDLRSVLRDEGPLTAERVASLLRAIAPPVEAAHRQGVLHRDLKPENVLLPDDGVAAKVLDFGIAKLVASEGADENDTLTLAGQPIGTPAYMAPEQLAGAAVSTRTDVFALGAIAYELLTGVPPFGRGPLVDIATRHRTGPPPIDRDDVPAAMEDAIRAALAADATERPESATLFASALVT